MDEKLIKAQDIVLDRINQICSKFGLNNIMAQLYAILHLSNKPLSLDDMLQRLKISKGSVSVNIRALERYGAVRKAWIKGSRKDYYEAEADIAKVIMARVMSMAQNRLSEVDEMVNSAYRSLNSVNSSSKEEEEALKLFKERLDKLIALHSKAQLLFNLFNSGFLNHVLNKKTKSSKAGKFNNKVGAVS